MLGTARGDMKRFFLEVLAGSGRGRKVEIKSSLTLGRSRDNDLPFTGEEAGIVSARHALLALKGQSLWLRDLDSTNGTFVGKARVTERELLGGEIISLGPMGPALRVLVAEGEIEEPPTESMPAGTLVASRDSVGLLGTQPGEKTLMREMARKLRRANPQDAVSGMLRDPGRLERLLRGGVLPEKVADWMGSVGARAVRSRRRLLWIGSPVAAAGFAVLLVLVYQNFTYRTQLKRQGDLLAEIHDLEKGLLGLESHAPADRVPLVHQLLAAERQLWQIREKLRLPDRLGTYKSPLGADVHGVLERLGKKGFIVPDNFIRSVQEQIEWFRSPENRSTLVLCFARQPRYARLIKREMAAKKLPADFLYIAMQESLLDTLALSPSDARGLWQMVPATARSHGLQVPEDWKDLPSSQDERTHAARSTRAAAEYLHLLYSEFGDAALAMAAYNTGPSNLRRVLRQISDPVNDRDFWYLYRMGMLPPETLEYVPKIIAMILIDGNRDKYGFKLRG